MSAFTVGEIFSYGLLDIGIEEVSEEGLIEIAILSEGEPIAYTFIKEEKLVQIRDLGQKLVREEADGRTK